MKIKFILLIILCLVIARGFSQAKDRRAAFWPEGTIKDLAVTFNGTMWLVTDNAKLYYANNVDSGWHLLSNYFPDSLTRMGNDNLFRLSFFNQDTAILVGKINAEKSREKTGYYLTHDGGKHWQVMNIGLTKPGYILSAFTDSRGNAWITEMGGEVYFSGDFGQHFQALNLKSKLSTSDLFMNDGETGIAGGLWNELMTTRNNWLKTKKIETPFDQGKYGDEETDNEREQKIIKIQAWKNYWVVNQNGHIFYSDTGKIDWKRFVKPLTNFETDSRSGKLFGVSDSLFVWTFTSPLDFYKASDQQLNAPAFTMRVAGQDLYLLTSVNGVYQVKVYVLKDKKLIRCGFYSNDQQIQSPYILTKGKQERWAAVANELYREDSLGWFRETTLDFNIHTIHLLNDSEVVVWDGVKNNYLYSSKDHTLTDFYYKNPLQNFISTPVQSLNIHINTRTSSSWARWQTIVYHRNKRGKLSTGTNLIYSDKPSRYNHRRPLRYQNTIRRQSIDSVIAHINNNPYAIPSIKDLKITNRDKRRYLKKINKQYAGKTYQNNEDRGIRKFYLSVPAMLDTLSPTTLKRLFDEKGIGSGSMRICLVNQKGDSLSISGRQVEFQKKMFAINSVELTNFISKCIPRRFRKQLKGSSNMINIAYTLHRIKNNQLNSAR